MTTNTVKNDRLYLDAAALLSFPDRVYPVTIKQAFDAFARRQAVEGFRSGYIGHSVRFGPNADKWDRWILGILVNRGFDIEDCYQFMNSRPARHLGDSMQDDSVQPGDVYKTADAMWEDFGERLTSNWSGWKFKIVKEAI